MTGGAYKRFGFSNQRSLAICFWGLTFASGQFLSSEILAEVFMWRVMTSSGCRKVGHGLFFGPSV